MTRILCMSHGPLAKGMVETAQIIVGQVSHLNSICAYVDGNNDIESLIDEYIEKNQEEELVVVTDIFGGSINNAWLNRVQEQKNIFLIAGMNLSFLIELLMKINNGGNKDVEKSITEAMEASRENFIYCNAMNQEIHLDDF